jgi:hypothetical protein
MTLAFLLFIFVTMADVSFGTVHRLDILYDVSVAVSPPTDCLFMGKDKMDGGHLEDEDG